MNVLFTASYKNGVFSNGLQQNIICLAELLKSLGHSVFICIDHPMEDVVNPPVDILILEEKELDTLPKIDFILQAGWVFTKKSIDFMKKKNSSCKNIHIHYGNRMLADVEQAAWDNLCIDTYSVDEVWTSPHYEDAIQYFKTYYSTDNVFIVPYIWSDKYVKLLQSKVEERGQSCFYSPSADKNIAIVEPNLNMTKHCIPAIMTAERMFKEKPDLVNNVYVYCTSRLRGKTFFKSLMWQLDIVKAGRVTFCDRKRIHLILSNEANIVLSHQMMNGLNYTYLEALYFNCPLVHNSKYIKDYGYYYDNYNIIDGASKLQEVFLSYDDNIDDHKKKSKEILFKYSDKNIDNVNFYKNKIR